MASVLDLTRGITVKPAQTKYDQLFSDYYCKNWQPCHDMWTAPYRRRLPTMGINDTQGCERQHGVLKQSIELKFSGRIPSMPELIEAMPGILDNTIYQHQKLYSRRLTYHHVEPCLMP